MSMSWLLELRNEALFLFSDEDISIAGSGQLGEP
jgi:hypothetical protein